MPEITRMRDVTIQVGGRVIALCSLVEIHRDWANIDFPLYRDRSTNRVIKTLEKIQVIIEKTYQEAQDLIQQLGASGITCTLIAGDETHTLSGGTIIGHQLKGGADGELVERAVILAETFS